jgi:hypothetical protein
MNAEQACKKRCQSSPLSWKCILTPHCNTTTHTRIAKIKILTILSGGETME